MDQQQRRVIPPAIALPAGSSSTSSSPLLGINDDFYELLQQQQSSVTQAATTRLFSDPIIIPAGAVGGALKMEPELVGGDFMGSSYAWGTTPQYGTQLIYNDANTLTNYGAEQQQQAGAPPVVDIAAQFATYAAPVASTTTTGAQIQALRDFMVYGNLGATPAAAMSSRATTPVGAPGGFYSDEVAVGVDGVNIPSLPIPGMPSLAYRALCSEIYATTTERSPHRSQFQRENHILAERQRREEMNEKFSALRAMIPKATKKDKASIVGDTIDYVLELEKRLKQLQACKASSGKLQQLGSSSCLQMKKRKTSRCDEDALLLESPIAASNGASTSSETTTTLLLPVLHVGDCSAASSPSDQITAESKLQSGGGGKAKLDAAAAAAAAEVDVQQLGKQAVMKVVCTRQPGHVLRVLNALEECCKVEVLQSNLMTVADHSIHFVTVQLEEGVSVQTEELVSAVLRAINPAEA